MNIGAYYRLAKPGIVYGNMLHTFAGLLVAVTYYDWSWGAAAGVMAGTSLIIASACAANNVIDCNYDQVMKRTKKRPLVTGELRAHHAIMFAIITALVGFAVLSISANVLTLMLGVVAYISYTFLYTYSKRYTVHNTVIGTVPGALPAVAGYTALSNSLDVVAWLLFALIAAWQLPHFYAIAVYLRAEYARAGWKILSTHLSGAAMRRVIQLTVLLFLIAAVVFAVNVLHLWAAMILIVVTLYWVIVAFGPVDASERWAKRVFGASMFVSLTIVLSALVNFGLRVGLG